MAITDILSLKVLSMTVQTRKLLLRGMCYMKPNKPKFLYDDQPINVSCVVWSLICILYILGALTCIILYRGLVA